MLRDWDHTNTQCPPPLVPCADIAHIRLGSSWTLHPHRCHEASYSGCFGGCCARDSAVLRGPGVTVP